MRVWVDADACPVQIRDLINRAVHRRAIPTIYVANKKLPLPESVHITSVQVSQGPDVADDYIVEQAQEGDLVVSQDIPLAAKLVPKGIVVISPRGDLFNKENVHECLARRDLMQSLRDAGEISGGPAPFDDKVKREFANKFDASLHKLEKSKTTN